MRLLYIPLVLIGVPLIALLQGCFSEDETRQRLSDFCGGLGLALPPGCG